MWRQASQTQGKSTRDQDQDVATNNRRPSQKSDNAWEEVMSNIGLN